MFSIGDYVKRSDLQKKIDLKTLSDQELKLLQESILDIYRDVLSVCDKSGIRVMMVAGSAIGAVRHKGFIPWDDDMDFLVSRDDYYPFVENFCKELGDKYHVISPFAITKYHDICIRIVRKDMNLISLWDNKRIYPNGVALDIATYENVPNNLLLRILHGFVSDSMLFITNSRRMVLCRTNVTDSFFGLTFKSKFFYAIRLLIGELAAIIPYKTWCSCFDRWGALFKNKRGKWVTIPAGGVHYFGEMVHSDVFSPVQEGIFEGLKAYLPNKYDEYLKNRYGEDYMTIPPEEKREKHQFVEFGVNSSDRVIL